MCMLNAVAHQSSMQELDLLNPQLDPRITFSRASTKTYFGSNGLMQTAAADVWPLEYDPITLQPLGRSVWEQRTNTIIRSQQPGTSRFGITETDNAAVAPDGTATMVLQTNDGNSGQHWKQVAAAWPAAASPATHSIYIKKGAANFVHIFIAGPAAYAQFNLTTGALVFSDAGTMTGFSASLIQTLPGGFFRFAITATNMDGVTRNIRVYFLDAAQNTGAPTEVSSSTGYWWGEQMEAAAFASPYIPTAGSQVTRVRDTIKNIGTAQFRYNPVEGVLYAEASFVGPAGGGVVAEFNSGSSAERFGMSRHPTLRLSGYTRSASGAGGDVLTPTNPQLTVGPIYKALMARRDDEVRASVGGILSPNDLTAARPAVTELWLGNGPFGGSELNGYLRSIRVYPSRLSDTELQALTA